MPAGHPAEVPLRHYATVLSHRKWFVVLGVVTVVAAAVGFSALQSNRYTAQAEILLQPRSQALILQTGQQAALTPADVTTQAAVVTSGAVRADVAKALGSAPSVSVSEVGQTNLIRIRATAGAAALAAHIANTYATSYVGVRRQANVDTLLAEAQQIQQQTALLDQQAQREIGAQRDALLGQEAVFRAQLAQLQGNAALSTGDAQIVTTAPVPASPSSPRPKRDGLIGAGLGLLLGIGLALLVDYLDDAIYAPEAIERLAPDLPLLGLIPAVRDWKDRRRAELISVHEPLAPASEAYRSLRTSVQFLSLEKPVRVLQVTSPSAGEGKTTTAVNLGVSLANTGLSTLVVDCDLRHPRAHQFFGLEHEAGFTSILLGQIQLSEAIQPASDVPNLYILPSGPIPANPSEVLSTQRAADLIKAMRDQFEVVIIDSPPVLPVTDSAVLSKEVDGTLMVVAAGDTTRRHLTRALELMRVVDAPLIGLSLNSLKGHRGGYGYGYGYGYGGGYGYAPDVERGPDVPITPGSAMMTTGEGVRAGASRRAATLERLRSVANGAKPTSRDGAAPNSGVSSAGTSINLTDEASEDPTDRAAMTAANGGGTYSGDSDDTQGRSRSRRRR